MSNEFPIPNDNVDSVAYPLAIEAVLGATLSGASDKNKAADDWVEKVLQGKDPNNQIKARAMHFVQRVTLGPTPLK